MSDIRWFDRASDELEDDLASGSISQAEFSKAMADLRRELRQQHDEERDEAVRRVDREWEG